MNSFSAALEQTSSVLEDQAIPAIATSSGVEPVERRDVLVGRPVVVHQVPEQELHPDSEEQHAARALALKIKFLFST